LLEINDKTWSLFASVGRLAATCASPDKTVMNNQAEPRHWQWHPSMVHERVKAGVLGIHPVFGDPFHPGGRHIGARIGELSVLPQQGVVLD
jgi:hypothetical protein